MQIMAVTLWSAELDSPQAVADSYIEVNTHCSPRSGLTIGEGGLCFISTSQTDHMASPYFYVLSSEGTECQLIVELDWPTSRGKHPTVLLQTPSLEEFARIDGIELTCEWASPVIPHACCPERLRVLILFIEPTQYVLPKALRVSLRQSSPFAAPGARAQIGSVLMPPIRSSCPSSHPAISKIPRWEGSVSPEMGVNWVGAVTRRYYLQEPV